MGRIVNPITATVEVIGRLKESSYQAGTFYRPVLFIDVSKPAASDEAKIWKSLSEEECQGLSKGAVVKLVPAGKDKNGNDKHNIVLPDSPNHEPAPVSDGVFWSDDQKRKMAAAANHYFDLYVFCYTTAEKRLGDKISNEESLRAVATTIFLQVLKTI